MTSTKKGSVKYRFFHLACHFPNPAPKKGSTVMYLSQSRLRLRNSHPATGSGLLESMVGYVPQMVITQYLDNPHLESPCDAKPENFPAAVLFVDISGTH
jgi:hypothetical protein